MFVQKSDITSDFLVTSAPSLKEGYTGCRMDSGMFFKYKTDNITRGHSWALAKEMCKLNMYKKECIFSTNDK